MRFSLTLYLTAFVATTGIMASPIPAPELINPNTVSDVGNSMQEPEWKTKFRPWLKRIAILGFSHQVITRGYPWVLDFIHDRFSEGYDEAWLAQFDDVEGASPGAEGEAESDDELPGGEVTF